MDPAGFLISAAQLRDELAARKGIVLLDVREPEEHAESRIDGCVLIPLGELQQSAEAKLADKDAEIVVYCAHGIRSMQGLMMLRILGYMNTRSLEGGIESWHQLNGAG